MPDRSAVPTPAPSPPPVKVELGIGKVGQVRSVVESKPVPCRSAGPTPSRPSSKDGTLRAAVRHAAGGVVARVLAEAYERTGHTEPAAGWGPRWRNYPTNPPRRHRPGDGLPGPAPGRQPQLRRGRRDRPGAARLRPRRPHPADALDK